MQLHQSSKELSAPLFPVLPFFKAQKTTASRIMTLLMAVNEVSVNSRFSDGLTHKTDLCNVASEAPQRQRQVGS